METAEVTATFLGSQPAVYAILLIRRTLLDAYQSLQDWAVCVCVVKLARCKSFHQCLQVLEQSDHRCDQL